MRSSQESWGVKSLANVSLPAFEVYPPFVPSSLHAILYFRSWSQVILVYGGTSGGLEKLDREDSEIHVVKKAVRFMVTKKGVRDNTTFTKELFSSLKSACMPLMQKEVNSASSLFDHKKESSSRSLQSLDNPSWLWWWAGKGSARDLRVNDESRKTERESKIVLE